MSDVYSPTRLLRVPQPIDHPDFLYEVKHDGFRAHWNHALIGKAWRETAVYGNRQTD